MKEYLSQNDFRVSTVATGKEMMGGACRRGDRSPLFFDLGLQGEDGLRHAQRLREDFEDSNHHRDGAPR